ncbi:MAG TPA: TonB-dependent receptor [Ramlibacter sp.]|uniref:TonB-dependent receptor n=1 Tax=Ramlibacter sp. TaxID=1917967 RepID=UPI002C3038D7|nr:TonB-dependent receptor [Ramlibacter sp.]HVZ46029.1 TonB-dependent receptor [Ramlibacter sp.]
MQTDTLKRFRRTGVAHAVLTVLCGTASMLAAHEALAQQTTPPPQQTLQRVEVTGSNIKRTDTETASPVQILTREDIEKTGKQSIQEVLRTVTADNQGSIPTSFSAGFASGSSAVSLRGMGVNSTLVLVNGRRMTTYGLADDGTRNFVDLNSLPLEAVDRIEVLKDGASAIYGADAVGGVVNVILRKNYSGRSIGASLGMAEKGDGQMARVFGSAGFGDMDRDKYNFFFTAEYSQQRNIWSTDRGFLGVSDLRSRNFYDTSLGAPRLYLGVTSPTINSPWGTLRDLPVPGAGTRTNVIACPPGQVDPDTNVCRYNSLIDQEIQPQIDRFNIFARGTREFSPNLTGYMELGFFNSITKANGTLGANNDGGVFNPNDLFNPLVFHDPMILPAGHPDNPFGVDKVLGYRPFELGGRDQETNNQVWRLVAGLQGTAWGWDYDTGLAWIHSRLHNRNTGYIIYDRMQETLNNGTYRINLPNTTPQSVLDYVSPELVNVPTSSVKLIDFKANRELMNLGGGPLGVAVGAEMRWEESDNPPVPFTDTASIVGLGYSTFHASRHVSSVFGEVNAPVTKWLELNGALRYDNYSDFGSTTNPKLGFKLKPIDQFAVRGTYSESFRAPGPAETGGSSFGFTSVGILSQGNPNIQPETSRNYTLGIIAEPWAGTSATVDYWKIDRKNEIIQADPAAIIPPGTPISGGPPSTRLPGLLPNTFLYYDSQGVLTTVTGFYRNANSTKTDGYDVELRHRMNLGAIGKLTAQLAWSHTNKFQRTDASGTTSDYAGTHGPIALSSGAGTPKDKATFALTLDRGAWTISGQVNYVGPLKMIDHQGEMAFDNGDGTVSDSSNGLVWNYDGTSSLNCGVYNLTGQPYNGCKLPSFTTFDLYAKWTPIKNLDINFSVQNLFDRKAPFDPYLVLTYGINYNQTWHQAGAVGRFFTIGARYTF